MKILITGICGFVGSTLAKTWVERDSGHVIYGIDNFIRPGSETNRMLLKKIGVNIYHADLRCPSDFEALPFVDFVVDAAANPFVQSGVDNQTSSRQLVEHNLFGTANILEYCKTRKAGLVLLSTSRVYSIEPLSSLVVETVDGAFRPVINDSTPHGLSQKGISEDFSNQAPISLYGATKLSSEALALEFGSAYSFPVWINRCGIMAGATQFGRPDQGILAFWINSWLRKHPLKYIGFDGQGHQVRDCLHPKDLVPLLDDQMNYSLTDKVKLQNVSGGIASAFSLKHLSDWCRNRFGNHDVQSEPTPRPYDVPWLVLDSNLAKKQWKWEPKTSRNDILEEIAHHAEKNPNWLQVSALI